MSDLKIDAEKEREKIRNLVKSLYSVIDENELESIVDCSMEFDVENKYDEEDDEYAKLYDVKNSSDSVVKTTPFEDLLTSQFVD